eukprot:438074-Alexandrium_andersonii.AAC.1
MTLGLPGRAASQAEGERAAATAVRACRLALVPAAVPKRRGFALASLVPKRSWAVGVCGRPPTRAAARSFEALLRAVAVGRPTAAEAGVRSSPDLWAVMAGHRVDLQAQ